ncbi:hypothetical protein [Hymenobacter elongatus]|uniref:Uncharacterized protein n=1 Tax=Hymenobacter elongatus TaxID=877208 RepID=A0A4Z0PHQ6_9BACT|nr:hypothetical protein [Hymenobacter elongatus]TGE13821.1 hypothetical protein E5J99_18885 [Hymenobacter elongatus]
MKSPSKPVLAAALHRYNDTPQPDFCGLSPAQMHPLLYQPLGPASVVQLRANVPDEVLNQVPFLRLTEAFLQLLQRETPLRLTPLGALPRKYLRELYAHGFLREEGLETGLFTLSREIDSLAITTLHQTTRLAGLARLVRGQLLLTKKGTQLLDPAHRPALWALVLDTFTNRFLWASHDGYPSQTVGQTGWAYSVYLLARFGQQPHPVSFYAAHYQRAFPFVLAEFTDPVYRTPLEQLTHCYGVRTFERGLNWFGLLGPEPQASVLYQPDQPLSASPLLAQLFDVQQAPV